MKFNVEIEIDFIEEDGTIDDIVKEEIVSSIVRQSQKKLEAVSKVAEEKINDLLQKGIDSRIEKVCNDIVDSFCSKEFTTTDNWGDVLEVTTIDEYLKKRFSEYWGEHVDDSGGTGRNRYGKSMERFKWHVDKQIEKSAKEFAHTLSNDTENKIKASMKKTLQDRIGEKLVNELGLDNLLLEKK